MKFIAVVTETFVIEAEDEREVRRIWAEGGLSGEGTYLHGNVMSFPVIDELGAGTVMLDPEGRPDDEGIAPYPEGYLGSGD